MPEIIPNLHPVAVHFPIALTLIALLFGLASRLFKGHAASMQWAVVGHWSLWLAAIGAVIAANLGWLAYNSVNHDAAGHTAMQAHRNWAVPTAVGLVALALWDAWKYKAVQIVSFPVIVILFALTASITATAWLGGEVVYRHGIGVLSLPEEEEGEEGHHQDHDHAHALETDGHTHQHGSVEESHDPHTH